MVLENYKQKIQFMKAILNKGDHINMEFVVGWMAVSTKVSITWEKNKEQENIDSTTEEFMRDNGQMENNTGKERSYTSMVQLWREIGNKVDEYDIIISLRIQLTYY